MRFLKERFDANAKFTLDYDNNLEGLRGFAALAVMLYHGFNMPILDKSYLPSHYIGLLSLSGLAVYIFFVLSGYVIGINYRNAAVFKTGLYLKKRLVRLFPIYLIAITFAFSLNPHIKWNQLIGNMFMLQNSNGNGLYKIDLIGYIATTWSIHYEIIYYFIFPVIILIRPKIWLVVLLISIPLLFGSAGFSIPFFLLDYLIGFSFWLAGLLLAWKTIKSNEIEYNFLSYIFLLLAYQHLNPGLIIFNGIGFKSELIGVGEASLGLKTFVYLPLCTLIIAELANRKLPFHRFCIYFNYFFLFLIFGLIAITKGVNSFTENDRWLICLLFYVLSLAIFIIKPFKVPILLYFKKIGKISYAIYLLHMPIAYMITNCFYFLSGTNIAYWTKFIIWIFTTLFLSRLLELKLQPYIRRKFLRTKYGH